MGEQLFSVLGDRLISYSGLSGTALARGIDLYQKGDYDGSIREFRRAISLDPYSENSIKAYDFMAQAYLKINRPEDAKKTYIEAIRLFPGDDTLHQKLGTIYYDEKRYSEAEKEYLLAVKLNPSSENLYSLGQAYLALRKYSEAEETFHQIMRYEPSNYGAIYSLGQVYAKKGLYNEAIKRFKEAINLKKDFAYAYYDIGMVYADIGDFASTEEQIRILEEINKDLASELKLYLFKVKRPKIAFVRTLDAFDLTHGPGTQVSSLHPELTEPGASKKFSLIFYFDKPMDRSSVENITNWLITRSYDISYGGLYNWGMPLPETEVSLNPLPYLVIYNSNTMSATVYFTISQNATANGTIDPSHIVFRFFGKDAYGNPMDPSADEYTGLSLIV